MPSWIVDDPSLVFLILGISALCLTALWWQTRNRHLLVGLGAIAALFFIVWLLSKLINTDSKQIEGKLQSMAAGVKNSNPEQIFEHISRDFKLGSLGKDGFRPIVEEYMKSRKVTGMEVWNFSAKDVSRSGKKATVVFKVKGKGTANFGYEFFNCQAVFVLDPDDQWRLQSFQLYPPHIDPASGQSLSLPFVHN
jgi:hypothetical protein